MVVSRSLLPEFTLSVRHKPHFRDTPCAVACALLQADHEKLLSSLERCAVCLETRFPEKLNRNLRLPSAVFVLAAAPQTTFSLCSKFLKNLGSMSKMPTHIFLTSERSVSSKISDVRNRWLHAVCACAEWYSRSCIPQAIVVHWYIKCAENWWLGCRVGIQG